MRSLVLVALAVAAFAPSTAGAHALTPALLSIVERADVGASQIEVTFKRPVSAESGEVPDLTPVLPESCDRRSAVETHDVPGAVVTKAKYRCDGLAGAVIAVRGLEEAKSDVLVRVQLADGETVQSVLRKDATSFVVPESLSASSVAWDYAAMGVEHILGGFDHLAFVLAILALVGWGRSLLVTITAFTVGHSATLGAATLGWAAPRPGPVELIIALSVLLLAWELARRDRPSLTRRHPWLVAGGFGLLHGFGFAGALAQVGLPSKEVPLALLSFNVGVELGQLAVVFAAVALAALAKKLPRQLPKLAFEVAVYGLGGISVFWCLERVAAVI